MNIKNITVIKSSLLTSLLLILIVVITGCITRDGEILGRNNPVDPFNKNRKVFSIDTLWNSFDKSASTGTLNCTIQVESSFFRLYVLQNDSLEAVYSGNTNSFLISNMRPATIRNYIFVAYTSQTDSLIDSGFIETPSGIPPEAPQNLTASGTISGITLYWTGTKQTGETVTIYRADSLNGNFIQKATTTDTIYIDSVKTYNPFIYMISARNRFGETRCTTVVSARRLINTPPPSGIMITENMTDSTITIRWKAVPGITSYIIFKSDKENGSYEELGKRNDTTITIKSIPGDTVYYKIAVIVQNDKCGLLSNAVMGYVSPRVTPPENVNASQGLYDNYIKISWNRVAGAQKYIIYRTTTQNGIPAIIDSTKDTTYTDTVNSASEYFYSISSQGSNGYRSQRSNTVTGFIKIIPAPIGLSASDGTDNRFINLSWNPYSGSSSFKIYKSKHPDSTFIPIGTSILPEYQDTVPDVFTWYFKVSSINHKGIESRLSDFDSGYRKGLNAPLNPRASQGEYPLYVYITWGTVSGASYYKIYRSTAPFTTFQLLAVSTSPSYIDSSSVSSSYYRISGVDSYGVEGGMSAAVIGYPGALGTTSRISASFDRPKSIVVTWDSVQNAEKYIVYRSSNISNFYPLDTVTSLSYADSSVKSAYYKVAIIYKTRTGQLSSYAYGTVLFPPSSVQLSADSTKFNLSWTEITGATRYRIYRSTDNSVFSPLDTTNKHTYSDTKIKKGTFYYYKISSLSQYGESSQSQSIQGIVLAAPTGLKSSASHDTITVRWDTVPFATSYQLYFKSKSDSNYDSPYQTSNTTIKFIATETSVYSFQVRAANNVSISGFSKQDSCAVTARPLPPINFLAFSNPGFIKLSWRPDSSGGKPDSYIIYRSNTAYGTYTAIDTINDTTYSDTLRQPVDRYYKVSALNTSGVSSQTSWLRSSSLSISAPRSVSVSTQYGTHIEVKWNKVTGAQSYILYRSTSIQNLPAIDTLTDTIFRDSSCVPGTAYYYAVASIGLPGTSVKTTSNIAGMRLPAPNNVNATGSAAYILVQWSKVQNASSYSVYRAITPAGNYVKIASTQDTVYKDSLKTKDAYYYKVSSNNLSESPLSTSNDSARLQFPSAPSTVTATKGTLEDVVQISWSSSEGAFAYLIYRSSNNLFSDITFIDSTAATQTRDTVPSDSVYYYLVKAVGYAGESSPGPIVSGYRIPHVLPDPPQELKATSSALFIHLEWEAPQSEIPITGYKIYRSESATGPYTLIDSTIVLSYDDYAPKSFPVYYWYRINSYNTQGESLPSNSIRATRN